MIIFDLIYGTITNIEGILFCILASIAIPTVIFIFICLLIKIFQYIAIKMNVLNSEQSQYNWKFFPENTTQQNKNLFWLFIALMIIAAAFRR